MMHCTWVLSLLILILPACLQHSRARVLRTEQADLLCSSLDNSISEKKTDQGRSISRGNEEMDYRLKVLALEAKFSDIPIPLGSEPIYDLFKESPVNDKSILLGYANKAVQSDLCGFFRTEFLRLGWNFMGSLQGVESILTFEKPDRICSVSLRPAEDATVLIIMVYPKNSEFDQK